MNLSDILFFLRTRVINESKISYEIITRIFLDENSRMELLSIPKKFWADVVTNGAFIKEKNVFFEKSYVSYTYELHNGIMVPTIINYRSLEYENKKNNLILSVLCSDNNVDFLGYNETKFIIDKILSDDVLFKQLKEIPDGFWCNALNKMLVYSDFTAVTRNKKDICLEYKYQNFFNDLGNVPALVYQKKKKLR